MHHKNIKVIVRKQLKTQSPNWKRLGRKVKQTLVKQFLAEVETKCDGLEKVKPPNPFEEKLSFERLCPRELLLGNSAPRGCMKDEGRMAAMGKNAL